MIEHNAHLAPYLAVSQIFSALSNPARSAIVHRLTESPCFVGELVDHLDVAQPLVSQHLKVLREAALVRAVREGRQHRYELTDQHVTHLFLDAYNHTREHNPTDLTANDDAPLA
ncbi:ArsR/SmtB family transcription factor [Kocuria sp.]|uniref:ArsR/SmtB family transcription factor n=1 Tax=Kocuria sp. TaxID=1871328 RepID=UPI0026E02E44|nr:metalloregulator ArsR/SmtB family transcription factor [Kocuria sp.]MDO5617904.1 metalloregulator ArsR/SmtB family transcription factor [Kocuria sp.]